MTSSAQRLPDVSLEAASRFVAASGFVVDEVTDTHLRGHVDLGEDHHTPWGVVHGGVYATIVERSGSIAASHAVALHQGRTQQLWQVVITDEATAKVLARGQLRLQNVPLRDGAA